MTASKREYETITWKPLGSHICLISMYFEKNIKKTTGSQITKWYFAVNNEIPNSFTMGYINIADTYTRVNPNSLFILKGLPGRLFQWYSNRIYLNLL